MPVESGADGVIALVLAEETIEDVAAMLGQLCERLAHPERLVEHCERLVHAGWLQFVVRERLEPRARALGVYAKAARELGAAEVQRDLCRRVSAAWCAAVA